MSISYYIAGNWKMNGSKALVTEMSRTLQSLSSDPSVETIICPPSLFLESSQQAWQNTSVRLGLQNVSPHAPGAYTGELAVSMLSEFGVTYGIVGHSERRQYYGETNEIVNQKALALLAEGLRPIICVGESFEQRERGEQNQVVTAQIEECLKGLAVEQLEQCLIAYEPIWAIGTGKTASPQDANEMHQAIREQLPQLSACPPELAKAFPILYGGSAKAANAQSLLEQPHINGLLIGGASLKTDEFSQIIQTASTLASHH